MDPKIEQYIDKLAGRLVVHDIDDPARLSFSLDKLFDSSVVTCIVSHYRYPEDISQLVAAIRSVEADLKDEQPLQLLT